MTEYNEKEQILQKILSVIEQCICERKIRQKELISLCRDKGYTISQSELSRILTHKVVLGLYPAMAMCDVLGIDIMQILHPERKRRERFELSGKMFVVDPKRPEIENYLGAYNALFHATDFREDKLLYGRLELTPRDDGDHAYCSAVFVLNTDDMDMQGEPIKKKYQGQFFVSPQMGIAYCFLVNNNLGEICSIEFRHRVFFYKRVECRLGLVLTTSTGEKKMPATHKMLIYRGNLDFAQKEQLAHMLKLDNTEMYIEASILRKIGRTEEEKAFFEKLADLLPQTSYYTINAAMLKAVDRKLSHVQISSLFSILRNYSEEDYTLHLDDQEDEMVFDLIHRKQRGKDSDAVPLPGIMGEEINQERESGKGSKGM